jgi:hypothetical protein
MSLVIFNSPESIQTNLSTTGPVGANAFDKTITVKQGPAGLTSDTITLHKKAIVTATADVDSPLGSNQRINVAAGDGNCYWLPWGPGKCYIGNLPSGKKYFFTYKINGCGVIIGGTKAQPIVAHANMVSNRLVTTNDNDETTRIQTAVYESFYMGLAAQLQMTGELTGSQVTVYTPREYLSGAGFGAVFGICPAGEWTFYGNSGGKTTKIWG